MAITYIDAIRRDKLWQCSFDKRAGRQKIIRITAIAAVADFPKWKDYVEVRRIHKHCKGFMHG